MNITEVEEIERERRQRIVEQNGNDGTHYKEQVKKYYSAIGKETPQHYDNTNGTLYKIAEQRGWNAYQFDAIKRIDRVNKKGQFKEDIEKTITVLKLMLENK